jgi:hypothetical protein
LLFFLNINAEISVTINPIGDGSMKVRAAFLKGF